MITENLSTLKIHKLTQAQYDRELAAGRIDESALYLTPDEGIDLSPYALKSDISLTYETKVDANNKLNEAKTYADDIKDDLLNGAGEAYDTLKELADLIDENHDAIEALEIVATNKANKDEVYTKTEIDNLVLITPEDIDAICGQAITPNVNIVFNNFKVIDDGEGNVTIINNEEV